MKTSSFFWPADCENAPVSSSAGSSFVLVESVCGTLEKISDSLVAWVAEVEIALASAV